jgi:hypothetical protein
LAQLSSSEIDQLLDDLLSPEYVCRRQALEKIKELPISNIRTVGALVTTQETDENLLLRKLAMEVLQTPVHKTMLEQGEKDAIAKEVAQRSQARARKATQPTGHGLGFPSRESTGEKLGVLPYVIGGMSFIPLCGVIFGIVSIVGGLVTPKRGGKVLSLVGGLGIAFTVILYGALFYFGFIQRGGVYDSLRVQLAQTQLASAVQAIEFYKLQNGNYPRTLLDLQEPSQQIPPTYIFDPTIVNPSASQSLTFYYQVLKDGRGYYLLGVGADGKPFTFDDILPSIGAKNTGLLISPDSGPKPQ